MKRAFMDSTAGKLVTIYIPSWLAFLLICLAVARAGKPLQESGCADGTTDGLWHHFRLAVCQGSWEGHVSNASSALCGPGWRVCGWTDESDLRRVTYDEGLELHGCYAYDASQNGGRCQKCSGEKNEDKLGGIGNTCPFQVYGESSCITGGRMDAASVSRHSVPCHFNPKVTTGVVCCKLPGVRPKLSVRPPALRSASRGHQVKLECQAVGKPQPRVRWYKGSHILADSVEVPSKAGILLIREADLADSGVYFCVAQNDEGLDLSKTLLTITDEDSGCADDVADGLHFLPNITTCSGAWRGHVKKGRSLCARGWRVCSSRDVGLLKSITWAHALGVDGCYAYNAQNAKHRCTRCRSKHMAGIGRRCKFHQHSSGTSCILEGRIDVLDPKDKDKGSGCVYREGQMSGVLCCRKQQRRKKIRKSVLAAKENEILKDIDEPPDDCGNCGPNSICESRCKYPSSDQRKKVQTAGITCRAPCFHGGRCANGRCICSKDADMSLSVKHSR